MAGLALGLGLLACAGKQPTAAPASAPPAHAEPARKPEPAHEAHEEGRPVRDPFELDESADDPAAALESMKHNCCDEMPAREIREHVGGTPAQGTPPAR